MFDVKALGELRKINLRAEIHGDESVRAIDVTLMLLDVPVARLTSAVPDFEQRFYDGEQPVLQEISPFQIQHKMENIEAKIGKVTLKGADIKKGAKVWHKPGKVANLLVQVQSADFTDSALNTLSKHLRDELPVEIQERQMALEGMDQGMEQ